MNVIPRSRAAHVVVPVLVAVVVACSASSGTSTKHSTTSVAGSSSRRTATTATRRPGEDFVAQARDFVNLKDMTPVRGFFIANRLGHLDQAMAVAHNVNGGQYPVGTIIQLVPGEAMVKRASTFSPKTGNWEFFELDTSSKGTTIHKRGGAEIVNRFGGSCAGCHGAAEARFDFICEKTHGCAPLPVGDPVIKSIQDSDPRPRHPSS